MHLRSKGSIFTIVTAAAVFVLLVAGCARTPQQRAAAFLQRGKEEMDKRDYRRAVLEFRNAVEATPRAPEPYYQLGLAFLGTRDTASAVSSLWKALQLDPKYRAAELKLAELAAASSDRAEIAEAEKRLKRILTEGSADPTALNALGTAEWKLGKQEEAEEIFAQAATKFPKDVQSAINLAKTKLAQKDVAGAEKVLKTVQAANPRSADAAVILGEFYRLNGRQSEAAERFRAALRIDANHGVALLSLAALEWQAGRLPLADDLYKKAAALPISEYRPVHAIFLFQSGKRDQAIAELEKLAHQDPADRTLRSRLVAAYVATNKIPQAEDLLGAVLKKNNRDIDALIERAQLYIQAGRYTDAKQDLTIVLHFQPDSANAHFLLAQMYERQGTAASERQELTEAIRLDSKLLAARIRLAQLLISTKAPQNALDVLQAAPEVQRGSVPVLVAQNWANLALGRKSEARKGIDVVLNAGRNPEALYQDAVYRLEERDYGGARRSLEEALKQNHEFLGALDSMVQSYALQKQPEAALAWVREYATQNPNSAMIQGFLGRFLMKNGDLAAARSAFEGAKKADPASTNFDLYLAQLDLNQGNAEAAQKKLSALLVLKPEMFTARLLLETAQEKIGNYAAAIQQCREILNADSENLFALNNLAYFLTEYENQPSEALKYAQKAQELAPDNPTVADTLGWVLYRNGLYTGAIQYLGRAVSKEPTPMRQAHLGMAYFKSGRRQQGRELLQSALRADPRLSPALLKEIDTVR